MKDLFETPELIPHEVQAVLSLVAPVAVPYFPLGQDEGHAAA
jgi:hypothetical protein